MHKEIYPLMLFAQFNVQLILKFLKCPCFIVFPRYGYCFSLAPGGVDLDEMLDVIVVDII